MKLIRKIFRLYLPFTRSTLQRKMSYRLDYFMSILGQLIKCFVIYYLWKAVFVNSNASTVNGFTARDMIVYVFMSSITANIVSNSTDASIGNEVWDGSIAMNLIKPINYHTKLFFEAFAELIHGTICIAIPLWIGLVLVRYLSVSEVPPGIGTIVAYLLSSLLGFLILFLFNFCFGVLSFYVTNIWGIRNLKYAIVDFLSGAIIPIAFFPVSVQHGLNFVPFASVNYVPVSIYLNKITGSALLETFGVQVAWVIILLFLSILLWNKATKRLTILGG